MEQNINESIERSKLKIVQSLVYKNYKEAIEIYSRLIELQENNAQESSLLAERAGVYLLAKQYKDALNDSNNAINLDETNIYAHIQKSQSLYHLGQLKNARKAIQVGRQTIGADQRFDECEVFISKSWLTLDASYSALLDFISSWFNPNLYKIK
ncbi:hypothetical protein I4U23_009969 [Adineta vaga]|nr:hypothetical protein I4U23_009969 [Adineta vaga]